MYYIPLHFLRARRFHTSMYTLHITVLYRKQIIISNVLVANLYLRLYLWVAYNHKKLKPDLVIVSPTYLFAWVDWFRISLSPCYTVLRLLLCEGIFSAPAVKEKLIHAQPKVPALISRCPSDDKNTEKSI